MAQDGSWSGQTVHRLRDRAQVRAFLERHAPARGAG
jgi:hypothetical protein